MNPFSGFLQPQNRPLQGLATTQDLLRVNQGNKELAQRQLENTQQNTRANANLKLQQDYQTHSFEKDAHGRTVEEQKQIEGLLAEYQDAEDQGDPVRLSRASQMLKRFGMDVSQGPPNLRALTGEQTLPSVRKNPATAGTAPGTPPNLSDFRQSVPLDDIASEELKSREALRARSVSPEQDLSQEDFEEQLINGTQAAPSRYEEGGKTTDEFRKMLPQEPEDLGDVDDPTFKAAAAQESGDVIDLDAESPEPLQIGSAPQAPQAPQPARRLSTQLLPTVISKGGKQLYESTGPSGRLNPMVSSVFEPFTQHDNPEIGAAAKRAQAMSSKLVEVDGVSPKDAIKMGMDYLQNEATRLTGLERTKIGSRPRGGGGGGIPGKFQALGPKEDRAESIKGYITESRGAVGKLNESDRLLAQAEALANSKDPALQRNAIDVLVQSRSGATVSDRERARYDQLDGVLSQAQNYVARWSGGPLDPQYVNKIKMVIAEQRRINASTREEVAADLEEAYAAQNEGKVDLPILQRRKAALGKTIRRDNTTTGPSGYDPELDQ